MNTNQTSEAGEMMPCPFCGGEAMMFPPTCNAETPYNAADRAFPIVRCGRCSALVGGNNWDHRGRSAIETWNTRATESHLRAQLAAVTSELERSRGAQFKAEGSRSADTIMLIEQRTRASVAEQERDALRGQLAEAERRVSSLEEDGHVRSRLVVCQKCTGSGMLSWAESSGECMARLECGNCGAHGKVIKDTQAENERDAAQARAGELEGLLREARGKFIDYEMIVDEPAPYAHRDLMDRIDAALATSPHRLAGRGQ